MDFGFTLKPDHSIERTIALTRQAEAAGFTLRLAVRLARAVEGGLSAPDAHGAQHDARCGSAPASRTRRRASRRVTASALATLDEISGGRMDLGIGRGDSARRVLGKPPTTMKTLEEAIDAHPRPRRGPDRGVRGRRARAALGRVAGSCPSGSPATARWRSR